MVKSSAGRLINRNSQIWDHLYTFTMWLVPHSVPMDLDIFVYPGVKDWISFKYGLAILHAQQTLYLVILCQMILVQRCCIWSILAYKSHSLTPNREKCQGWSFCIELWETKTNIHRRHLKIGIDVQNDCLEKVQWLVIYFGYCRLYLCWISGVYYV